MLNEKKQTVLLVDDNVYNLELLFAALRPKNYKLLVAKNGMEAIERAEYALPDLIILDVLMPGIDGFETCKILKANEKTKDIPIIFMTALIETDSKVKGFELGAVDYITKPIQYEEVILRVQTHLLIDELKKSLKEKNQELENKNRQLDESLKKEIELNKLKSGLIYMASHELRTPLSIIYMTTEILKIKNLTKDEQNIKLSQIVKSVKVITKLLDDILIAISSETEQLPFNPQLFNLEGFLEEIIHDYKLINKEANIMFESNDIGDDIFADQNLLLHMVTNLLSNSIKYSSNGAPILFKVFNEDNKLNIIIKDNGIGISQEDQKFLFEEFKRGKNVGSISGTGLGLSIVKKCADIHNCEITVESQPNEGTTFKIVLDYLKESTS